MNLVVSRLFRRAKSSTDWLQDKRKLPAGWMEWRESSSRKKKRKTRATALEKERGTQQEEEGEVTPIFPLDGGEGQMTPPFPLDGNPSH